MIEIALAIFIGLVLFAAFGARAAILVEVATFVGLRRAWGPLGRFASWCGMIVAWLAIPAGIALGIASSGSGDTDRSVLIGGAIGGTVAAIVGGGLMLMGAGLTRIQRAIREAENRDAT